MENLHEEYIFYAKTSDGSTIKNLVDALTKQICKFEFRFQKDGIYGQMMNGKEKNNLLYDIELLRSNFHQYICEFDHKCLGLNAVHTQDQTYSIKKKHTVVLCIPRASPDHLYIEVILPTNGEQRRKRGYVTIQKIQYKVINLPQGYGDPVLLDPSDYQRTCKDINRTQSKKIILDVGDGWIKFRGDNRDITGCEFIFGNPTPTSTVLYTQKYDCSVLNSLLKASSMSKSNIKVYSACVNGEHRPLKLTFCAGTLGTMNVYIKCDELIEYEKACVSSDSDDGSSVYSSDEEEE